MPGSLKAIAGVHSGRNQTGKSLWPALGGGGRYAPVELTHPDHMHMWGQARSATLFAPAQGGACLIVFSGQVKGPGGFNATGFHGPFIQFLNNFPESHWKVNLKDFQHPNPSLKDWEDVSGALLLIHTQQQQETRVAIRQYIEPLVDEFVEGLSNRVSLDLWTLSWDPFPGLFSMAKEFLNPNEVYLRINFRLTVDIPKWPSDYHPRVTWWIRLWADAGRLWGNVQRWEYFVGSGVFTEFVATLLACEVRLARVRANQRINAALRTLSQNIPHPINDVYYLPGPHQATPPTGPTAHWGVYIFDTTGDVTVVVSA